MEEIEQTGSAAAEEGHWRKERKVRLKMEGRGRSKFREAERAVRALVLREVKLETEAAVAAEEAAKEDRGLTKRKGTERIVPREERLKEERLMVLVEAAKEDRGQSRLKGAERAALRVEKPQEAAHRGKGPAACALAANPEERPE